MANNLDFLTQITKITLPPNLSMIGSIGNTNGAHARGYQPSLNITMSGCKTKKVIQLPGAGFINFGCTFSSFNNKSGVITIQLGAGLDTLSVWRRTLGSFNTGNTASDLIALLSAFDGFNHFTGSFTGSAPGLVTSAVQYIANIALGSSPGANSFDPDANSPWVQVESYGAQWDSVTTQFINGSIEPGSKGSFGFQATHPTASSPKAMFVGGPGSLPNQLVAHFGSGGQASAHVANSPFQFDFADNPDIIALIKKHGHLFG